MSRYVRVEYNIVMKGTGKTKPPVIIEMTGGDFTELCGGNLPKDFLAGSAGPLEGKCPETGEVVWYEDFYLHTDLSDEAILRMAKGGEG